MRKLLRTYARKAIRALVSSGNSDASLRLILWIARREVDGRFARAEVLREDLTRYRKELTDDAIEAVGRYIHMLEQTETHRKEG